MNELTGLLTPTQAGHRLGLSAQRVRQLAEAGRLPVCMTPLGRLVDAAAVDALVKERRRMHPPGCTLKVPGGGVNDTL